MRVTGNGIDCTATFSSNQDVDEQVDFRQLDII